MSTAPVPVRNLVTQQVISFYAVHTSIVDALEAMNQPGQVLPFQLNNQWFAAECPWDTTLKGLVKAKVFRMVPCNGTKTDNPSDDELANRDLWALDVDNAESLGQVLCGGCDVLHAAVLKSRDLQRQYAAKQLKQQYLSDAQQRIEQLADTDPRKAAATTQLKLLRQKRWYSVAAVKKEFEPLFRMIDGHT